MPARRRTPTPRPNSLVAAAQVMTSPNATLGRVSVSRPDKWQEDAWRFYDEVGELRFGVNWIANALSRVNLVAAMPPLGPGDEPTPIDYEDERVTAVQQRAVEIVETIAGGASGQGQVMSAFGLHLSVAGLGWLVVEPDLDQPDSDVYATWNVYSTDEVRTDPSTGDLQIRTGPREWRDVHPNALVVKVWRRHPRRSWDADSPVHGVLGVLREIVMLQQHVQATAQSRLAGAGILAIPSEAVFPPGQSPQSSRNVDAENVNADEDDFVDTLIDAMVTPISDRGTAAAVVPLVVRVPGEYVDKVTHIAFSTPFDENVLGLQEAAIKRLALGLDIPPEILTGTSGMNHWGAWAVQEESITLHIEPLAEIITNALTMAYLRPALQSEGFSAEEIAEVMVWYDTTDLRTRPDRSASAVEAYDRFQLSGEALLREVGLSVDDMPTEEERRERILLQVLRSLPSSAPMILAELGLMDNLPTPTEVEARATPELPPAPETQGPPDTLPETRAAVLAAADMIVQRAMERAGARLRSACGKSVPGGAANVQCEDITLLHCQVDATSHAPLESLLAGAWDNVGTVAQRYGVDAHRLTQGLNDYARGLLATGKAHTWERLTNAVDL